MPHSSVRPAFKLRNVSVAIGVFAACASMAAVVHVLIAPWARDVRAASVLLALLLLVAMTWLVGRRRYRVTESLVALIVVEGLFAAAIGWFGYGGLPRPDRFFLAWFLPGNLFIALPWLVGTALSAWLSRAVIRRGEVR